MPQDNNLEKAVSAAHTFLQKNPDDPYLTKNMNYYKTLLDLKEYLVDHEERPYEVCSLLSLSYSSIPLRCKLNSTELLLVMVAHPGLVPNEAQHQMILLCCPECVPEGREAV